MKLALLPSALLVLLASCGPNKHLNAWDRQSSALDPVGITSKKMAAKNKADQAFYKPGESVTFKKEKMMVFEQNPENNFSTSGTVRGGVKTGKVLVCGDLFAKVEFEDGSQGYVSLSEIVNPQEMMSFIPSPLPTWSVRTEPCFRCPRTWAPSVRKPLRLPANWICSGWILPWSPFRIPLLRHLREPHRRKPLRPARLSRNQA